MDPEQFRQCGRDMVDYIARYVATVGDRRPLPEVQPGYLKELVPDSAPEEGQKWEDVMTDLDRVIMPGLAHRQSNRFHAFFRMGHSFADVLGAIFTHGTANLSYSWKASPASTELEVTVMNWLAKMADLPSHFRFTDDGTGGGVILGSGSEANLTALLSARTAKIRRMKEKFPDMTQGQIIDKLVAYSSDDAHSSVEKAALYGLVPLRKLPTDEDGSLRGPTLEAAVKDDLAKGLVPFFLCATVGTTSCCAFDNLEELGPVCNAHAMWMHVDAAYAGSACICPEFRYLLNGVEFCTSVNFNSHKWMHVCLEGALFWVKDSRLISNAFQVNPVYLMNSNEQEGFSMPEYRHWTIPLCRSFRALRPWFVVRMFGVKGLQETIRKDVSLAKQFEVHVRQDFRFEIFGQVTLSLVCFRLKGPNELSEKLLAKIHGDGRIYVIPSVVKDIYFLRFTIASSTAEPSDVLLAWRVIQEVTDGLFNDVKDPEDKRGQTNLE